MELTGGCHCGAVRYAISGDPHHIALCHCSDCRRSAGAPMVSWAAFPEDALTVSQGEPTVFNSSGKTLRSFCPNCGTGLFYRNADFLPGIVDIQSATLDEPELLAPGIHIQAAERIGWMETAHTLPVAQRYPSQG
ncbi:MAG: GFA family protein [Novosphingobium sp.]